MSDRAEALLPVHRNRPCRDRFGTVWSWSNERFMWLNELRGETDRRAWGSQEYMDSHGRYHGQFTAAD